jgi:hypothetical protein
MGSSWADHELSRMITSIFRVMQTRFLESFQECWPSQWCATTRDYPSFFPNLPLKKFKPTNFGKRRTLPT